MSCHIIKDKISGEEFLIPDCYSVVNNWHIEGMADREIIKAYCSCHRPKREKYETKTRDEVFITIDKMEQSIILQKNKLKELEEELDMLKSEVFMLNTVVVTDLSKLK